MKIREPLNLDSTSDMVEKGGRWTMFVDEFM